MSNQWYGRLMPGRIGMQGALLLAVWAGLPGMVAAGDTVAVATGRYIHDPGLGLVVVAMTGDEVQAQWPGMKEGVRAGAFFQFDAPVPAIATGQRYEAVDTAGNGVAVYFTNLPLVQITTEQTIVDEPKVPGRFSLWSPGQVIDQYSIGIEYRGAYAQTLPKKPYRIEFREDSDQTVTRDVALLGMRSDDDWNLQAFSIEPLRLRSVIGQELWMDIHQPYYAFLEPEAMGGVRHAFVELAVNGTYRGLYAVGERVDRKQLKVKKTTSQYRGLVYKGESWSGVTTFDVVPPPYVAGQPTWAGFKAIYPDDVPDWETLSEFAHFVAEASVADFHAQVDQRFHRGNAVDYYIFMNALKAADNTGKNLYVARYKEHEPFFYVPWDLDGILGINWDGSPDDGSQWVLTNGLYDRWLDGPEGNSFRWAVCDRWWQLRQNELSTAGILQRFQDRHAELAASGVYEREEMAWSGYHHDPAQLDYMEQWLDARLLAMDNMMILACGTVGVGGEVPTAVQLYPNPAMDRVTVELNSAGAGIRLDLFNAMGQLVSSTPASDAWTVLDLNGVRPGTYLVRAVRDGLPLAACTLVVQ